MNEWSVAGHTLFLPCGSQAFFCWSFRTSSFFRQMTHIPPKLIWETTGWIKTLLSYFDILFGNKGMKASFFLFLYIIAYTFRVTFWGDKHADGIGIPCLVNHHIFLSASFYKSDNLQYNTLALWVTGMIVSLTKHLMFQVLFLSSPIACKWSF